MVPCGVGDGIQSISSVAQSCPTLWATPWTAARQASRPSPILRVYPNSCPMSPWCHPAISFSVVPFSSCTQSFPASGSFPWVRSSHQVANVLEYHLQHQSFQRTSRTDLLQNGLVGSPWSPRDSQESSPTPQFKRNNSSALSFLCSPILTSIHDYLKNHSLEYMDLCWQSNVSDFNMLSRLVITFLPRSKHLLISWL